MAPENRCLEYYDRFLLGWGLFSGAFAVSFRECIFFHVIIYLVHHPIDSQPLKLVVFGVPGMKTCFGWGEIFSQLPLQFTSGKLTMENAPGLKKYFPIENEDILASYVSLPEVISRVK